jgi:urease accessory protein
MTARASLATEAYIAATGRADSRIRILHSGAPLVLRPTRPDGNDPPLWPLDRLVRVHLAAAAAGPLGGDDFALDVHVGAGSALFLKEVSATLVLPGPRGGQSRLRIAIHVQNGGTLVWLAEPVIAAAGCDHRHDIDVTLGRTARLLMREELLLGRHHEPPGRISQRVRVRRDGRPLYQQELELGGDTDAWQGPSVIGNAKCVGTVLVVDPDRDNNPADARILGADSALLPLAGPGAVVTALAGDTVQLRRLLEAGIGRLGAPQGGRAETAAGLDGRQDLAVPSPSRWRAKDPATKERT